MESIPESSSLIRRSRGKKHPTMSEQKEERKNWKQKGRTALRFLDEVRGWHHHVMPSQYPYVIGGYWGETDRRNFERKGDGK